MAKNIFSFAAGMALGVVAGALMEEKNRQKIMEQANKIRSNYEDVLEKNVEKIKAGLSNSKK